uniref:Small nuclear ribonucleoprotein G-like n=1 Tax=Camelus bactrianus TaxID=9837 RepID=A0A9W3FYM0_CAMBA|nr:small nuclear ribonucleoprotein G-like [Camelus bactrianus]
MDKILSLKLNGGRHVQGILQGFDYFMNLVIRECVEMATSGQQNSAGMLVIPGDRIIMEEALELVRMTAVFAREAHCFHVSLSTFYYNKNWVVDIFFAELFC